MSVQIKQKKFRWLGHTLRKDNDDITKYSLVWNPQGQRKRGRPKNTWRRETEKEIGGFADAETAAKDRRGWRKIVSGLSSIQEE